MTQFLDTNILLYAVSPKPEEVAKRIASWALLDRDDCALSVQVLNEFMWQSTRPNRGPGLSFEAATQAASAWRRFPVQNLDLAMHDRATELVLRLKLAWCDSLIIAAAQAQGCDILYSEGMQDGRIIGGMLIVNPFA